MTRLCIIVAALALIARVRVPVLPGWVVPLPVLLTFALFMLCVAVVAWAVLHTPRGWRPPADVPEPGAAEVTGS